MSVTGGAGATPSDGDHQPTRPGQRIAAIDALRGFALCGILLINILAMGGPIEVSHPEARPDLGHPDWQVFWVSTVFVEGAMRGLFSFLFGAGMLLFLREAEGATPAAGRNRLFRRRAAWLALFGVINGTLLLWPGDILLIYGIAAFLILPFAKAAPRRLLTVAATLIAGLTAFSALGAWAGGGVTPETVAEANAAIAHERAARLGGYWENLVFMARTSWEWTVTPTFLWWIADGMAAMLIGMALLKARILTGEAPARVYVLLAIAGFGLAIPLGLIEGWITFTHYGVEQPLAAALVQPRRIALTLGWLGAFMLLWRSGRARGLFAPLAALGRMALSGYIAQSILAALVFSGFGLGLWGALNWPGRWAVAALIMAAEIAFAVLWLRRYRFGPMEWLWRWLTYGKRPRLRQPSPLAGEGGA